MTTESPVIKRPASTPVAHEVTLAETKETCSWFGVKAEKHVWGPSPGNPLVESKVPSGGHRQGAPGLRGGTERAHPGLPLRASQSLAWDLCLSGVHGPVG